MEYKTLVVGGEDVLWAQLHQPLADRGYGLGVVHSAEEARAVLSWAVLDLLILDLDLLDISGFDLIQHVRSISPATKLLAATADPKKEQQALSLGCDRCLWKPLTWDGLVGPVCRLLAEKDAEEIRQSVLCALDSEMPRGNWPDAKLLLLEPETKTARTLLKFFRTPHLAKGVYMIERTAVFEQALRIVEFIQPDIVLANLPFISMFGHPAEVIRELLGCKVQPKDYIFYEMGPGRNEEIPVDLPGKRWVGNLSDEEGLKSLADLVGKTALEHGLVLQ